MATSRSKKLQKLWIKGILIIFHVWLIYMLLLINVIAPHLPTTKTTTTYREIHVELATDNIIFQKLLNFLSENSTILVALVGPQFYDFWKTNYNGNLTHSEYEAKLTQQYAELKKHASNFVIHIHISFPWGIHYYSYSLQYAMIQKETSWFRSIGFDTRELITGWFSFDSNTEKAARDLGLDLHQRQTGTVIHDYEL